MPTPLMHAMVDWIFFHGLDQGMAPQSLLCSPPPSTLLLSGKVCFSFVRSTCTRDAPQCLSLLYVNLSTCNSRVSRVQMNSPSPPRLVVTLPCVTGSLPCQTEPHFGRSVTCTSASVGAVPVSIVFICTLYFISELATPRSQSSSKPSTQ